LILLFIVVFMVWSHILYLTNDDLSHRVKPSILGDSLIGYIIQFILLFLSFSVISYSFSFKGKFSKIGKYFYETIINTILEKMGKSKK